MTNSAPFLSGRRVATLPRTTTVRTSSGVSRFRPAVGTGPADTLWREHGWGLGGSAVAAVVGLVLAASGLAHLLG